MKIQEDNIEDFFFLKIEGQLQEPLVKKLNLFLEKNDKFLLEEKLWDRAHFRDIELEEYPYKNTLIKKKGIGWSGKLFFYLLITVGLGLVVSSNQHNHKQLPVKHDLGSIIKQKNQNGYRLQHEDLTQKEVTKKEIVNSVSVLKLKDNTTTIVRKKEKNISSVLLPKRNFNLLIQNNSLIFIEKIEKLNNSKRKRTKKQIKKAKRKQRNKIMMKGDVKAVPNNNVGF